MRNKNNTLLIAIVLAGLILVTPFSMALGKGVSLMTKEELKPILNDEDVVVIDVRSGRDWRSSEFKIPGAVYVDPGKFLDWEANYAKDNKLVLYCA